MQRAEPKRELPEPQDSGWASLKVGANILLPWGSHLCGCILWVPYKIEISVYIVIPAPAVKKGRMYSGSPLPSSLLIKY